VRGWDNNLPGRILGPLPKRQWVKRLQRLGQELVGRLWWQVVDQSPAPRRRGQWTWGGDDRLCKKWGRQLGLGGRWWSGQGQRVRWGIDGPRLIVVIGEGQLVIPVDFVVRRPDPQGPGRPCRDKRTWRQVMWDRPWAVWRRRCRRWPAPWVVADRWLGASGLMAQVATFPQGLVVVEGKTSDVFSVADGRRVKGHDVLTRVDWRWHDSGQWPGVR
jgi:hypothetical protein